jgi:hypothetical protein
METGPVIAVAYRRKDPGEIDTGTAAGKEEIVVELVLFGRGALEGRALYREHDGRVVSGAEHEAAKPRLVVVPAKGKALRTIERGLGSCVREHIPSSTRDRVRTNCLSRAAGRRWQPSVRAVRGYACL